ncbi:MAG: ribonuclease H-like domain-containing protein [Eubacterium sp.]|nr:ribonuclease H-like domain-containing protein [Eubacterium sp.]
MRKTEKIIDKKLNPSQEKIITESSLLFDIETTGLSSKFCYIYIIGAAYLKNDVIHFIQYFAESKDDEELMIKEFIKLSESFNTYITFNGINFDIRFISDRAKKYGFDTSVFSKDHTDLYKLIMPLKGVLGLSSLRQQAIECFLNDDRTDETSGGELIAVYNEFLEKNDEKLFEILYLHNRDDVLGLVEVCKMQGYISLFDPSEEKEGYLAENNAKECVYSIMLTHPVPKSLNLLKNGIYLHAENNKAYLKLPLYSGELKYFYPNYKDYWFYPDEDMAVHSSLAVYSDKTHRIKATAKTAYTKVKGCFLPAAECEGNKFYDEYKGNAYIEIKEPGSLPAGYLNQILNTLKN